MLRRGTQRGNCVLWSHLNLSRPHSMAQSSPKWTVEIKVEVGVSLNNEELSNKWAIKRLEEEFPWSPVVRTPHFHWGALGSVPGWGTKIRSAGKKSKKQRREGLQGKNTQLKFFIIFVFKRIYLQCQLAYSDWVDESVLSDGWSGWPFIQRLWEPL